MKPQWAVTHVGDPGALPAIDLSGPGVKALALYLAQLLADAARYEGPLAGVWDDYLTARGNRANAGDLLSEDADPQRLEDEEDAAWDALACELPCTVRLNVAEAQYLAGLLFEATGRVGSVWAA